MALCANMNGRRNVWVFHPDRMTEAEPPAPTRALEPSKDGFSGFIGQDAAVKSLRISVRAAKLRGESPPPILLSGPPGLGKTRLAQCVAGELGSRMHRTEGPALSDPGALLGILSEIKKGDVLFIDEIHRLVPTVTECLYRALDESALSLTVACGSRTRLLKLELEPFLLIGATTEEGLLLRPLHSRFLIRERLDFYSERDLKKIAVAGGQDLGVEVAPGAAEILARGSRGTPRALLGHLRRGRDLAQIEDGAAGCGPAVQISKRIAGEALDSQGIDGKGLNSTDRKLLGILRGINRPVGLRTLSALVGEDSRTVLDVHEPYLLWAGLLIRTRQGRVVTWKASEWLRVAHQAAS